MPNSLIEILCLGGCYWKRERAESPGHSIAIRNGTRFKIAIGGSQNTPFIFGACRDGRFAMNESSHSGTGFASANEAVNAVRGPSSNAFLHMYFLIDGDWQSADELRRSQSTELDEAEEHALEIALTAVRQRPKGKSLDTPTALKEAAKRVARYPTMIEDARRILSSSDPLEDLFK